MFEGFFGQYGEVDMAPTAGCEPMAKEFSVRFIRDPRDPS